MDIFIYKPIDLERPAFRLLQLLGGKGQVIECMLYQAYLDGADTVPYDALSYTWGGTDKTSTVKVNGKTLNVTENLHSALQHLRSEGIDRVLWVDAICIDQDNERERGHQVEQMCKIYSQAEEVIVWLGQATEETKILMESLRRLEEYSSMHGHRHWDLAQWTTFWLLVPQDPGFESRRGLDLLLRRPWFRRVWILQEIANAKKASIWCGTKSVRARTFALAPSLIGIKPERHCQAVLDIMPGRLREESWWSENRDLYNLLLKFSESKASDPRDNVYALLGISSDAYDNNNLRPDYTKGLQEVICDTALFLFGPSDVSYETMPKLLEDLASRNATSFLEVVETSNIRGVEHFLMRRGLEVPLSEDMIKGAVGNEKSGGDIMRLFLQKRRSEVEVTEAVVKAAAENAALYEGHEEVVKLLLDKGADVNVQGGHFGNALYTASYRGYEAVVQLLLNYGADVNAQGGDYGNALQAASYGGYEQTVKMLLDKGAKTVKMLLNKGANVNARGGYYGNALQAASREGHKQVVNMLLDAGAKVNAQGREYGNALQAASREGHEQVVKMLLDSGANVNSQGGDYGNALQAASREGHKQVVNMLLDAGAKVNAQGGDYGNALQAASYGGYEQTVKMLLDKGAEVNAQGGDYGNALQAASARNHEQVVKMLLDAGAEVNAQGGYYGNALQAASHGGYEQTVKMLLDKGADVNAQGGRYRNALQAALSRGYEQTVKMLLNKGANVNAQGGRYRNALQAALSRGYEQTVKMLLNKGANVNSQGGD
ncbi:Arp, Ankyrin repeat protein, partial [Pyrenophora tritici-repentis]